MGSMADLHPLLRLPPPSQRFFANSAAQFPAFVGGFGSGKTHALILRAMRLKTMDRNQDVGYYLPTYDLVETIAYPRFEEFLTIANIPFQINKSLKTISFPNCGKIIFRTMDKPERIVGYETGHSLVDELDTLTKEKAREVWIKILSRNRQRNDSGAPNSIGVGTTPEGFRFVYETWKQNPKPGYKLYKARTVENPYLPEGYIQTLRDVYPAQLLAAYLEGEFVNMTSGTVYSSYDRVRCASFATVKPGEPLHIGMDFNVGKMAAVVHVFRDMEPHAVEELMDLLDTPDMIAAIKRRFPGHQINVYPDASGNNRKTVGASISDIGLLQQAGFNVYVNPANPAVKDRIIAMNNMFAKGKYKVNHMTCPKYASSLEQQAYKNNEPDKSGGHDHGNDAGGYFIVYRFPVIRPQSNVSNLRG